MSIPGSLSFASFGDWEPGNKVELNFETPSNFYIYKNNKLQY